MDALKPLTYISKAGQWTGRGAFLAYVALFLIYFAGCLIHRSTPGNVDVVLYLGLFEGYYNAVIGFISGVDPGMSNFPAGHIWLYSEPSFGSFLIYLPFRVLGLPPVVSYTCFIIVCFSLNAAAVYQVCRTWDQHAAAAFLAGLVFSCANFVFCQIDNQNALVFFPSIFSLYYLLRYFQRHNQKHLLTALLLLGSQLYFSSYLFYFSLFIWVLIYLSNRHAATWRVAFLSAGMTGIFILPFWMLYVFKSPIPADQSALLNIELVDRLGLGWRDFVSFHPGNLLYGGSVPDGAAGGITFQKNAAIGISGFLILLLSVFRTVGRRWVFVMIILGILMALGPFVQLGNFRIAAPYQLLLLGDNFLCGFKHISRAFILAILGMSILSSFVFNSALRPEAPAVFRWTVVLVAALYFLENVPVRQITASTGQIDQLVSEIRDKVPVAGEDVLYFQPGLEDIYSSKEMRKIEYVYLYIQTRLKVNTANGSGGFIPQDRLDWDRDFCHMTQSVTGDLIVIDLVNLDGHRTDTDCARENIRYYEFELKGFLRLATGKPGGTNDYQ